MNALATIQNTQAVNYSGASNDRQLVSLWLNGKTPATIKAYTANIAAFFDHIDGKPLAAISIADIQNFLATTPLDQNGKPRLNTVKARLIALKSLFAYALSVGYLNFNVTAAVKLPTMPNTLAARILTQKQVKAIRAAAESEREKAMIALGFDGMLRISEIAKLTVGDCRLNEKGQIVLTLRETKSGGTQFVLINKTAAAVLAPLLNNDPEKPLFPSRKGGTALTPTQVHRILKDVFHRAGLADNVSAHWLRHAGATTAINKGASVPLVSKTLRHKSIATTSRYIDINPEESASLFLD